MPNTPPTNAIHIEFDRRALADVCKRWHIRRLSLFGSVLRDDFGPDSDVDVINATDITDAAKKIVAAAG